jgi:hypothetical protein
VPTGAALVLLEFVEDDFTQFAVELLAMGPLIPEERGRK